jgi:FtsP/CotA-like multicopper oxidase with cupredoxin domain
MALALATVAVIRGTPTAAQMSGEAANDQAAHGQSSADPVNEPQLSDASRIQHLESLEASGDRSIFPPFPGPAGEPGELDPLTFPPPPEPAEEGRVREFTLIVQNKTIEVAKNTFFEAWTFNGTVPGPVLRVTQGDLVRITLKNAGTHAHTLHLHGIHSAEMDGVFEPVPPGGEFTYEFVAEPFGVFPYHCHAEPLDQHVSRGMYGMLIIDPPEPRPEATEMAMVLNGYDLNQDGENEIYTVNGIGNYFARFPIKLKVGEKVRIYLVNMTEFDAVNSMHIHANMFDYYPNGTSLEPSELTDVVTMGIAERGILEFTYEHPGRYMFHAHQAELGMLGWMGFFDVEEA